jgi:hypothetical protein
MLVRCWQKAPVQHFSGYGVRSCYPEGLKEEGQQELIQPACLVRSPPIGTSMTGYPGPGLHPSRRQMPYKQRPDCQCLVGYHPGRLIESIRNVSQAPRPYGWLHSICTASAIASTRARKYGYDERPGWCLGPEFMHLSPDQTDTNRRCLC